MRQPLSIIIPTKHNNIAIHSSNERLLVLMQRIRMRQFIQQNRSKRAAKKRTAKKGPPKKAA
jgi:hypothetical protein